VEAGEADAEYEAEGGEEADGEGEEAAAARTVGQALEDLEGRLARLQLELDTQAKYARAAPEGGETRWARWVADGEGERVWHGLFRADYSWGKVSIAQGPTAGPSMPATQPKPPPSPCAGAGHAHVSLRPQRPAGAVLQAAQTAARRPAGSVKTSRRGRSVLRAGVCRAGTRRARQGLGDRQLGTACLPASQQARWLADYNRQTRCSA
jgi:hypothetical protein